ncbi:MAG: ribbon-helix-helix domain-containing protein [Nitrososphaerales archaeon]
MVVVIPIRFKEKDLKKIDELVKGGVFKSRSEAIRNLSLEAAESKYVGLANSNLSKAVEAILDALKKDRSSLSITLEKKIAEYIAEGRERL